jgi:enoyl-CoA hydratase/carnithine racemase
VTGDFHISTQMVGADTSDFYPALEDVEAGKAITRGWSKTARRLHDDFEVSVAMVPGKRCLGGMLELLLHCHYVVAVDDARFGFPEVTLPVVPGMEGCHWPLRRAPEEDRRRVLQILLTGRPVKAEDAVGWLIDYAGPLDDALKTAWSVASSGGEGLTLRPLEEGPLGPFGEPEDLPEADSPAMDAARRAIVACAQAAGGVSLAESLAIQADLAAAFLAGPTCLKGAVGAEYTKTTKI